MSEAITFSEGCATAIQQLSVSAQRAAEGFRILSQQIAILRLLWLPTVGGEWPDRFVLLNRYMRTGLAPNYFTDERIELT